MKNRRLYVTLGVIALVVILIFSGAKNTYNSMVKYDEGVNVAWSQVVTDYQRRMDLIPNLVNTVKGYADFEQELLLALSRLVPMPQRLTSMLITLMKTRCA